MHPLQPIMHRGTTLLHSHTINSPTPPISSRARRRPAVTRLVAGARAEDALWWVATLSNAMVASEAIEASSSSFGLQDVHPALARRSTGAKSVRNGGYLLPQPLEHATLVSTELRPDRRPSINPHLPAANFLPFESPMAWSSLIVGCVESSPPQ